MTNDRGDEAAIRAAVDTWHRATSAGDIARVLPLMAEDVVFLASERPPMRGRATFERALTALLETQAIASRGEVREVQISGDLAYSWTELTVTMTPLDGRPPTKRTGPALSVFGRQANGRWLLVRDANMLVPEVAELELKVDNLERELMADGPGG